ncbi:MAG: RNA-protein complex protein Nop10 [Candidatus Aenigmarchaeota archaeon]|nr:RNA-protein complex protein Nop10 [Candidatus Aenigmarchaeota archaeon]
MKLNKCTNCNVYTFKQLCPKCGNNAKNPNPPKYSPEDVYGKYRRLGKQFK